VTISYRRAAFTRLKQRNEERITRFVAENRVRVLFNSLVESIEPGQAVLQVENTGAVREILIPADCVFVLAGGEPPYPLLKKIGIQSHGQEPPPIPSPPTEKAAIV
jgi:thioredoxin reductase